MGMLQEFKAFAMRGNVVDMAVGIVIGVAFGKIVSALVERVIMPPLGLVTGGMDFSNQKIVLKPAVLEDGAVKVAEVAIGYGVLINTIIEFLMVAFALFLVIKAMNRMQRKEEAKPIALPTKDQELLGEIRDLLKAQQGPKTGQSR
jgi:large conductance mechanosensitive channel